MEKKMLIMIILIIIVIVVLLLVKYNITGRSVKTEQVQIVPMPISDKAKVQGVVQSSEFIKDIPKSGVISLRFYKFENGNRIWQDEFLIGKDKLLDSGEADVYLALHSKYIAELSQGNLCEVIQKANKNGDLGFYSTISDAKLLWKYSGMLKHRKCFGF